MPASGFMACDTTAHDQLLDPICCLALLRELAVGMVGDMLVVQGDGQLHSMIFSCTFRRDFGSLACALPLAVCLSVSRGITEMVHARIGYCSSVLVSLWFLSDS